MKNVIPILMLQEKVAEKWTTMIQWFQRKKFEEAVVKIITEKSE